MTEEFSKYTTEQQRFKAFETLIAQQNAEIDLARAALLIATIEYPDLDIAHYMAQFDFLAQRVRALLGMPPLDALPVAQQPLEYIVQHSIIDAINTVLFEEMHFRGNEADYYNPANSFLNKVLDDHTGIPISLSLVYIETAKRVGVKIDGIGLPFHFVVRCHLPQETIYIDPFEGGTLLSEQDCRERIQRTVGNKTRLPRHLFEPVSHKQFLLRMLMNLKHIYLHGEDYIHALAVCNYIVMLNPTAAEELRDRGTIHLQLKHYARALHDLTAYLELAPQAEDRYEIQNHIKTTRQIMAMMN